MIGIIIYIVSGIRGFGAKLFLDSAWEDEFSMKFLNMPSLCFAIFVPNGYRHDFYMSKIKYPEVHL